MKTYCFLFRLWWIFAICCSLYCCIYLITLTWNKWITTPVIVSFATQETPIFDIPHPAVTICPEVKTRPNIFNYTDLLFKKEDGIQLDPDMYTYYKYKKYFLHILIF